MAQFSYGLPYEFCTAPLGAAQALHRLLLTFRAHKRMYLPVVWSQTGQRQHRGTMEHWQCCCCPEPWGPRAFQLCGGRQGRKAHFYHLCPSLFALSASHQHGTFLSLHAERMKLFTTQQDKINLWLGMSHALSLEGHSRLWLLPVSP